MNKKEINSRRLGALTGINPYDDVFKTGKDAYEKGKAEGIKEEQKRILEILKHCKIIDPWGYKIILADWEGLQAKIKEDGKK